jgi:hypothetical protein
MVLLGARVSRLAHGSERVWRPARTQQELGRFIRGGSACPTVLSGYEAGHYLLTLRQDVPQLPFSMPLMNAAVRGVYFESFARPGAP